MILLNDLMIQKNKRKYITEFRSRGYRLVSNSSALQIYPQKSVVKNIKKNKTITTWNRGACNKPNCKFN